MNQYIISGLSPIPYWSASDSTAGFKAMRAASNASFTATEETSTDGSVSNVVLMAICNGLRLVCNIPAKDSSGNPTPEYSDYVATMKAHANTAILPSEVRFYTHDFADVSTWNGKTCGDPAAYYVGGAAVHPMTGLWVDATGAGMLAAYATPGSPGFQNSQYLYGALLHAITAQYDDINYRWVDNLANSWLNDPVNHPYTVYCRLDLSVTLPTAQNPTGSPAVWVDGTTGAVISQFDPTQGPNQILNDGTTRPRGSWMCKLPISLTATPSGSTLTGGAAGVPATGTLTLGGQPRAGEILNLIVNDVTYAYTTLSLDTLASIATGIVALCASDANVTATSSGPTITLTAKTAGVAGNSLTLAASIVAAKTDATSSRWRIDPYDAFKVSLRSVGMHVELTGEIPSGSYFRWKPYGKPSGQQAAQLVAMGLPTNVAYQGTEFVYHTLADFRFGCNDYSQSVAIEPGARTNTASMVYDYTKTQIPILDATQAQRLDVVIDNHLPVNRSKMARGTFIAVQHPAF